MLHHRTTLILGAGASIAYGFPTGIKLRNDLLDNANGLVETLESAAFQREAWEAARIAILKAQYSSVDDFLALYKEHAFIVKASIAHQLNVRESYGILDPRRDDHWYYYLLTEVLDDDPALKSGQLTVVTFNYDVSLEVYLYETLLARHRVSEEAARSALQALKITHIHGHLGPIAGAHGHGRAYGPFSTPAQYLDASRGISTCHEPASQDAVTAARALVAKSDRVIFLGFAYSNENLARLDLNSCLNPKTRVLGSVFRCPGWDKRLHPHLLKPGEFIPVEVSAPQAQTTALLENLMRLTASV